MNKLKQLSLMALVSAALFSCSKDKSENGTLVVRLTDAPAHYEEVLIDVQEVKINVSSTDENGWTTMDSVKPGIYNLLDLTNGMDTLLAQHELPAGTVSQLRLILGDNNQVKVDGKYYAMETPSAQQSGLKFNIHAEIEAGKSYMMWIDFDADKSIVANGKGYQLKPVIRTFTAETCGMIDGTVSLSDSAVLVHAISGANDTVTTIANAKTGYFLLRVMNAGEYRIVAESSDGSASVSKSVTVALGQKQNVGTISLQ